MKLNKGKEEQKREEYYVASQWQLMWRKFRKHQLAMTAVPVLGFLYFLAISCEFISPYGPLTRYSKYLNARPQRIHFFDKDKGFQLRPFIYDLKRKIDPATFRRTFTIDKAKRYPVCFFVRSEPYKLWGLFKSNLHLFGTQRGPIFLLGTHTLGSDLFSRTISASRTSQSIG